MGGEQDLVTQRAMLAFAECSPDYVIDPCTRWAILPGGGLLSEFLELLVTSSTSRRARRLGDSIFQNFNFYAFSYPSLHFCPSGSTLYLIIFIFLNMIR